jgi:2-dehydropantoate 2-reductase
VRILVMGAGGTGGYFGARLARAGADVTVVARGPHLDAIRAHGLRVRSDEEGEWGVRVPARDRLDGQPPADLALFCVKAFDTEEAAALIRPVVGPQTGVLSIQNGVDNVERLERLLGPGHVLGGVARIFATIEAPGVIRHSLLGEITFGEMDGRDTPRARAFLDACRRAAIPCDVTSDIRRALWEKYLFIAAQAGMSALTRCPAGVIREVPETRRMYRLILEELAALARAEDVGLPEGIVDRLMATLDRLGPGAYSSLYHDLTHGNRLELQTLHGHAVRLGQRHGVATPTIFAVYAALAPYLDGRPRPPSGG